MLRITFFDEVGYLSSGPDARERAFSCGEGVTLEEAAHDFHHEDHGIASVPSSAAESKGRKRRTKQERRHISI